MDEKKERRARLTAALRSGEFEQHRGSLRDDHGYCCLGVACELYRRETGVGEWVGWTFEIDGDGDAQVMLPDVSDYFGFTTTSGHYESHKRQLSIDNDGDSQLSIPPRSFDEIAQIIDDEPEGLIA